jgi:hypothetical protein
MGVWEEVAMDTLKFHLGLPCTTLLRPVGGLPLKQPYGGCLLPPWTPQTVRL